LLFTFVLLGGSLIWTGFSVISGPALLFTGIAVLIRTPVYLMSLLGSNVQRRGRLLIAWFGPRGLSSLLLILLPVFAGVPGSDQLFAICSLVVLVSVVVHGGSPMLLARMARRRALREGSITEVPPGFTREELQALAKSPAEPIHADANRSGASIDHGSNAAAVARAVEASDGGAAKAIESGASNDETEIGSQRISVEELKHLWEANEPVTILDVRSERSLEGSETQAKGAVRLAPDNVVARARELGLDTEGWLIAYCA
jgi:hypothetical protein